MERIDGLTHPQISLEEAYKAAVQTLLAQEWWSLLWTSVSR